MQAIVRLLQFGHRPVDKNTLCEVISFVNIQNEIISKKIQTKYFCLYFDRFDDGFADHAFCAINTELH
jgi:hypothetical protein